MFSAILLTAGGAALAFLKVHGRSLPTVLSGFLGFSTSPKIFLWKRKTTVLRMTEKKTAPEIIKKEKKGPQLKITVKSKLRDLATRVETKIQ